MLAVGALVLAAASLAAAPELPARSTTVSAVTVKAQPKVLQPPFWEFEISFDTHSQDLRDDLLKTAVLATPAGELRPVEWEGAPAGGHHRSGMLRFKAPERVSGPLVLRIQRDGESAPRIFEWQIN